MGIFIHILYMLEYMDRHLKDMISSIFQIANTKPQIQLLTIRLENIEVKPKQTIVPLKYS